MKKINFEKAKEKTKKIKFKKEKVENIDKIEKRKKKFGKEKEEVIKEELITDDVIKAKKKKIKIRIGYYLLVLITFIAICVFIGGIGFCYYIVKNAPEFDAAKLYEKEASLIYDADNNLIATLGAEKREKLTYNELPEVLVDAIVATEDSRFFQHNGFDLARFLKATAGQLMGSAAGGASTLTMQVSKNAFTSTESSGIAGIIRKFTDIYLSIFKIEKKYTKEEIIELYANSPYLGSGSYGVQQASKTYFGKDAKDLSLSEAALIAGLFQAPSAYDPYINPNDAEARRNQVLNLMVRHGYISEELAATAKEIKVKDLLVADKYGVINEYQGFVDTVVQAVIDDTGNNAYDVPMIIYSTMRKDKQDVINNFYSGKLGYEFKDNYIQVGISVIDNKNGAIIAVGAGRNKTKELTFNYATMTNAHPGSTAKPIFEYALGVEHYKWSTYTPFFDEKDTHYSSGGVIHNWNNKTEGISTLRRCLSQSKNTCAVEAFKQIDNEIIYNYVTSVGITPETAPGSTYVGEAHAIGGFTGVSPVTLSGAYSVFGSGGYYTKPYSYTKIVYRDTGEEKEKDISRTKVLSEQTTYIISNVLYAVTPSTVKVSGTNVATKTGTSSYETKYLKRFGLTNNVIRDSWVATYSPDYTLTFWYGYDALDDEHYNAGAYNTMSQASTQRNKIQGLLVNNIFEKNSKFKNPGGVVSSPVELETVPAQRPSAYTPSWLIENHLFISGSEPTEESTRYSKLSAPSNLKINEVGQIAHVTWASPGLPSAVDSAYLESYFKSGYLEWADKYYKKRLEDNAGGVGEFGFEIYLVKGTNSELIAWTKDTSYDIDLSKYNKAYDYVVVKSAYSIFKANASDGVSAELSTYEDPTKITVKLKGQSLNKGDKFTAASDKNSITSITINDSKITDYEIIAFKLSAIKNSKSSEVATNKVTEKAGAYTAEYKLTFSYTDESGSVKTYTKNATQSIEVIEPAESNYSQIE